MMATPLHICIKCFMPSHLSNQLEQAMDGVLTLIIVPCYHVTCRGGLLQRSTSFLPVRDQSETLLCMVWLLSDLESRQSYIFMMSFYQ